MGEIDQTAHVKQFQGQETETGNAQENKIIIAPDEKVAEFLK